MTLVFFCHNQKNVDAYRRVLDGQGGNLKLQFVCDDVRDVLRAWQPDVLVSPANSHGFMDGGIDNVYRAIFPEVETRVKNAIALLGIRSERGDPVLPVGSAILVETGPTEHGPLHTQVLACVPTMYVPSVVRDSRQVYDAMSGFLHIVRPGIVYAVPCLGTGVGGLDPTRSAQEVARALADHPRQRDVLFHTATMYVTGTGTGK